MNYTLRTSLVAAIGLFALLSAGETADAQVAAVPPLMNFQGRLAKPDGTPVADGTYSVRFSLWTALTAGTETWNQTINPVTVRNGTFAVLLSGFAVNTFDANRWLEIKIGINAPLTPRQPLVTVAYAFKANTVPDGAITTSKIANVAVTGAQIASGAITADKFAPNIFNPLAWLLNGNSGTNPANQFLGTTDNQPLNFRVNNRRAIRYSYAENTALEYRSINVLGGSEINSIGAGVVGATIAGGGWDSFTGTDLPNTITANFGTVGGGESNTASGLSATVGGGSSNTASSTFATVSGGYLNTASSAFATVSGGQRNIASEQMATVGGGYGNTASGADATVSGGYLNTASGLFTTVGGGVNNTASGASATVAGGFNNTAAGTSSFAAGSRAEANHNGAFVWGDSTAAAFASTGINQFLVRASGGVGINTNDPQGNALNVAGVAQMTGFKLPTGASAGRTLLSDASGNGTWGQVTSAGIADGTITNAKIATGTITADRLAPGTLNPIAWLLSGNSGVTSGFLGTTDNQPLNFRVNNRQAMRYSYAENTPGQYRSINVLGGSEINAIGVSTVGATIAGGGFDSFTGIDYPNSVTADFGTVGGGLGNAASEVATVGGGDNNTAGGLASAVGGGQENTASGILATVGGGGNNLASGVYPTVGGGRNNTASGSGSAVGGGSSNTASGGYATVGGGFSNTASGDSAVVAGGGSNTAAGTSSFAAGNQAKANHQGAFVWADSTNVDFASTGINQFLVRAAGGVGINTNAPTRALTIGGSGGTYLNLKDSGTFETLLGVDAGAGIFATMTSQPLELRLNNLRALRLEPAHYVYNGSGHYYDGPNVLGGFSGNQIVPGVVGSIIAGGGYLNYTGAVQGPGAFNKITARGSFIGGGVDNHIGFDGSVQDLANSFGTIGGGSGNRVEQPYAVIGGGSGNLATEIPSGEQTRLGGYSVIGGGDSNLVKDFYATVPGGRRNAATGAYSFAAGYRAKSQNTGTFVWADSQETDFISGRDNAFLVRASGGVGINTNNPNGNALSVNGSVACQTLTATNAGGSGLIGNTSVDFNAGVLGSANSGQGRGVIGQHPASGNYGYLGTAGVGVFGNAANAASTGGSFSNTSGGYALYATGQAGGTTGWFNASDARYKTHIATFPDALDTILNLRGVTFDWDREQWKDRGFAAGKQIGFIAQEVENILPELVITDSKGYKSVAYANIVPVLVEAVKAQQKQVEALKAENRELQARMKRLEALEAAVAELKAAQK